MSYKYNQHHSQPYRHDIHNPIGKKLSKQSILFITVSNLVFQGVFIDIFSLEKSFSELYLLASKLYNNLCYRFSHKKHFFKFNLFILKRFIYPIFRLISKLNHTTTLRHTYGMNYIKTRKKDEIFPLIEIPFEDSVFYAPHNYKAYLSRIFGDYMKIPDNKISHGNIEWID